jgi:hypothetical protein
MKKCKEENEIIEKIRNKRLNDISTLFDELRNKKITKTQFILKYKKIDDNYYKSIKTIDLLKCELDKCYEYVKYIIHELSNKINYTKKDIYNIKEYINILKKHSYYNSTLVEFI